MIDNNEIKASNKQLLEISEMLETFDINEIKNIVTEQIIHIDNNDTINNEVPDQFKPLYYAYKKILDSNENIDILKIAQSRFNIICNIFLDAIKEKYYISLDEEFKNSHINDIPSITLSLYSFFILDKMSNIEESITSYIIKNKDTLYKLFENSKSKKDATTLSNKKHYYIEYAIILSNIYDVISYILDNITVDEFFENMNQDYIPLKVIKDLYKNNILTGISMPSRLKEYEFIDAFNENYKNNINFKGILSFKISDKLRDNNFIMHTNFKVEETN